MLKEQGEQISTVTFIVSVLQCEFHLLHILLSGCGQI